MNAKFNSLIDIESRGSTANRGTDSTNWKTRNALLEQRLHLKRKLFGQHYNYSKVGLNKEKKYLLQEQKNTEIERNNLILLQKIQKIANRGLAIDPSLRISTQEEEDLESTEAKTKPIKTRINQMRQENKIRESHKVSINDSTSSHKSCRVTKKYAFQGVLDVNGQSCQIKTYFQHEECIIFIQTSDFSQKIKVTRENYMQVFNDLMDKKHSNIVNLLTYNGKMFEITEIEDPIIELGAPSELKLPQIEHNRFPGKRKTQGNL